MTFGPIKALQDVNLEIQDQEYVSIIGPSGCGKTTLIKCIAGIFTPSSGEVYMDGKPMSALPIQQRNIGYVFQEIALFPHLNVRSNISYGPRVKGLDERRAKLLVDELIKMIDLRDREESGALELSGGAQQKVAVARALGSGSGLLLLDEPFGALDVKVRSELRYEILRMVKDLKLTALHVTHDQEEAMSVADRVVVMKAGRVMEVGTPLDLYLQPQEIFTANFVGEANFLQGVVQDSSNGRSVVDVDGVHLNTTDSSHSDGERVIVAIRPEFLSIERSLDSDMNVLRGKVEGRIFMGSTVRYEIRTATEVAVIAKHPLCFGELGLELGDEVFLRVPPERVLLYSESERGLQKEMQLE